MNKNKKIIMGVVVVVVAVGLFYGGIKYGQAKTGSARVAGAGQFQRTFQNGQAGGARVGAGGARGMNGGFVAGEILSKDTTSITVKLPDGGSKIIFTSASTTVMKSTQGSMSDLATGSTVMIQGKANSDGSVTAQSIQIRK